MTGLIRITKKIGLFPIFFTNLQSVDCNLQLVVIYYYHTIEKEGEKMVQKRTLDLEKVIEKATEIISDKGLSAATMPNLAKALGVRSQSLYHYVSGHKQLISLVGANRIKILHQKLTENLMGLSGTDALLKFADVTRNYVLNDPALSSIIYHLNEYAKDDAINQEIQNIFSLGEKFNLKKDKAISFHALVGAVLGYVFLDKSAVYQGEDKQQADENYHHMILRLVEPVSTSTVKM